MIFFIILFGITGLLAVSDLLFFLGKKTRAFKRGLILIEGIAILIGPWLFLSLFDMDKTNDCCGESAFLSPRHRLTIYVLILLCTIAYFYSSYRRKPAPPVIELAVNCLLFAAIPLNILIAMQTEEPFLWVLGNISIIALFLTILLKNHQLILTEVLSNDTNEMNLFEKFCHRILNTPLFVKFPLFFVLCVPVLLLLSLMLFVFGQRPDSAIRAFTETYKHGLSQFDYMCDNVQCGGHYLCSVAANGHKKIVKPQRYGERNGGRIVCNRQLLISNAFEQLVEQRFPKAHLFIRKRYDKVGDIIHRDYKLFHNKYFSDLVYILMKPLEWFFLVTLYSFDLKPENRIAQQYINGLEIK